MPVRTSTAATCRNRASPSAAILSATSTRRGGASATTATGLFPLYRPDATLRRCPRSHSVGREEDGRLRQAGWRAGGDTRAVIVLQAHHRAALHLPDAEQALG